MPRTAPGPSPSADAMRADAEPERSGRRRARATRRRNAATSKAASPRSSSAVIAASPVQARAPKMFIGGSPMNEATNRLAGRSFSSAGVANCCEHALLHDRDAVGERDRLGLVVGDEHGRHPAR